jgi:hypothetical protein
MQSTDVVEIMYDGQLGACLVPRAELERLQNSAKSPRAIRHKILAGYRPDVVWQVGGTTNYLHLNIDVNDLQQFIISGGSELARLVTEADNQLVAMRKIVQ